MEQHVFVRVGDSENFYNSYSQKIWGILTDSSLLREGQILWFVTSDTATGGNGRIIAVARFVSKVGRLHTNAELGWCKEPGEQDLRYEINYEDIYDLQYLESEILKNPYKDRECIHVVKESVQIKRLDRLYNAIITLM